MNATPALRFPGRLGDPALEMRTDPRADPRMIAALAPFGLDGPPPPSGVHAGSSMDDLYAYCNAAEAGFEAFNAAVFSSLPPVPGVVTTSEVIRGVDGNDIELYIHRPKTAATNALPCVIHTHGGGMVLLKATAPGYVRWRDELAATGLVVIGVEFRNGGGALGNHPFPAGLNDCASAVQWAHGQRAALGISRIVVSGESGGGNLALATALKANREGWIDHIDGVYAQCPYISNVWADGSTELPSLVENDGYLLTVSDMGALARVYDPDLAHRDDPLAWPYVAAIADLEGLPPHVISVNELDPLRDEGLAYFRKLLAAGVPAVSRTVNGTCHAGDCLLRSALPDVYAATVNDICTFAGALA